MADPAAARVAALAVLGLREGASTQEVTQAYRRLARTAHPDATGRTDREAGAEFDAINEAYRALTSGPARLAPAAPPRTPPTPVRIRFRFRFDIVAGPVRITPSPRRRGPQAG